MDISIKTSAHHSVVVQKTNQLQIGECPQDGTGNIAEESEIPDLPVSWPCCSHHSLSKGSEKKCSEGCSGGSHCLCVSKNWMSYSPSAGWTRKGDVAEVCEWGQDTRKVGIVHCRVAQGWGCQRKLGRAQRRSEIGGSLGRCWPVQPVKETVDAKSLHHLWESGQINGK